MDSTPDLAGLIKAGMKKAEALIEQIKLIIEIEESTESLLDSLITENQGTREACRLQAIKSSSHKYHLSVKTETCLKCLIERIEKKSLSGHFDQKQKDEFEIKIKELKKALTEDEVS